MSTTTARLFWLLRTSFYSVLLVLGLSLMIQQAIQASQQPNDFCQDYIAVQRLAHGEPVYLPLHLWVGYSACPVPLPYDAHPPFSILFFFPLLLLPKVPAALLWGFCSLIAYLIGGLLLLQVVGWRSLRGLALFVIGSTFWEPFVLAQQTQNIEPVLLLLVIASWLLVRKGRDSLSGWFMGLAGLLKLWPILLLLGALGQRRRKVAWVGGLTLLLGSTLALVVLGPGAYADYLGPVRAAELYAVPANPNVSLASIVARLFIGYPDQAPLPPLLHGLSLADAVLVGETVAGAMLVGTLALVAWCTRQAGSEAVELLSQGLLITMALLFFPLIWYQGLVVLLLPAVTTMLALRQLLRPPRWWFALLGLSALPLLEPSWLTTCAEWLLGYQNALLDWIAEALVALPTCGLLLFAGVQAWLLWRASASQAVLLETKTEETHEASQAFSKSGAHALG